MVSALIALGGNVGDVRTTFKQAISDICALADAKLLARSSDYSTPAWGDEQQARFVNACMDIDTGLDPQALLAVLQQVESEYGRDRGTERRWGPRTLDLDLIAYGDISLQTAQLILPHPRLFERAFVLFPLAEIAPDRLIGGRSARIALGRLATAGIEKLADIQ